MKDVLRVCLIGALIRFIIPTVLPDLPFWFSSVVELLSPITSFKSLYEAFFYLEHDINPYDGGLNHHPPLLVMVMNMIYEYFPVSLRFIVFNALYTVVDLVIAWQLVLINRWYIEYKTKKNGAPVKGFDDSLIVSFYLFNPLIILTNLSHSTSVFSIFFFTETLVQLLVKKNLARSMLCMGVTTYLSVRYVYLIIPVLALAYSIQREPKTVYFQGPSLFVASFAFLILASFTLTASWEFIELCYFVVIFYKKIKPNLGLWWYIFTEMFDFFTPFYTGMFNIYSFCFITPITLRLFEYQGSSKKHTGDCFLAVVACALWLSFTNPYSTLSDLGFGLSLIPIFKGTVLPHCKYLLIIGLTLLVCLLLSPIFYYCWIVLGNGNSNFFYSISLIWGIIHGLILNDLLWAFLTHDYIKTNDVKPENAASIRLTQI